MEYIHAHAYMHMHMHMHMRMHMRMHMHMHNKQHVKNVQHVYVMLLCLFTSLVVPCACQAMFMSHAHALLVVACCIF